MGTENQCCWDISVFDLHKRIFLVLDAPFSFLGKDVDVMAREPLWSVGLDYRHGTGHGIGVFLNVHEGELTA